jgi:DNA-binding MarR family transcriptional regulator
MPRSTANNKLENAEKVLQTLRSFQKIDTGFPLQYAVCLIEIALAEGLSLSTLAKKTDIPLSTISRIAGALSTTRQKGKAYGLICVRTCPKEKRKKQLFLTRNGSRFINSLTIARKA